MPIESAVYISDLVTTNPVGSTDTVATLDNHIRLLKTVLQASFTGITGAVTSTHTRLNYLTSATGTTGTTSTNIVFSTSPTLVTPLLGTPTSGVLTNCTGLPISSGISGLGTGIATFLATPSSANLISAITDETGSSTLVFSASPTLTGTITAAAMNMSGALAVSSTVHVNSNSAGALRVGTAAGSTYAVDTSGSNGGFRYSDGTIIAIVGTANSRTFFGSQTNHNVDIFVNAGSVGYFASTGWNGAVVGNVTGNLTGTVLTAAQASITSLGTLTALTVSGTTSLTGNLLNFGTGSTLTPFIQHTGATLDVKGGSTGGLRVLNNAGTQANLTVADSGAVTLAGALTLTAGQAAFPATQNASADANVLDDYEEGTYTITITPDTSGTVTLSGSNDTGSYTKIGRKVTARGYAEVSAVSSPLGFFGISLPFAIADLTEGAGSGAGLVMVNGAVSKPPTAFVAIAVETLSSLRVYLGDTGTAVNTGSGAQLQAGTGIYFEVTYFTT